LKFLIGSSRNDLATGVVGYFGIEAALSTADFNSLKDRGFMDPTHLKSGGIITHISIAGLGPKQNHAKKAARKEKALDGSQEAKEVVELLKSLQNLRKVLEEKPLTGWRTYAAVAAFIASPPPRGLGRPALVIELLGLPMACNFEPSTGLANEFTWRGPKASIELQTSGLWSPSDVAAQWSEFAQDRPLEEFIVNPSLAPADNKMIKMLAWCDVIS
jgi:hypothetical protein